MGDICSLSHKTSNLLSLNNKYINQKEFRKVPKRCIAADAGGVCKICVYISICLTSSLGQQENSILFAR